jgi:hypothetical protein
MVLMKNSANAFAPSGVCCVASSGMIGGFSPGLVFGPVVGTSDGRLGCGGRGGPACELDGADVVGGGTETVGGAVETVGALERGDAVPDEVHAAQNSSTNAANVQIRPTTK